MSLDNTQSTTKPQLTHRDLLQIGKEKIIGRANKLQHKHNHRIMALLALEEFNTCKTLQLVSFYKPNFYLCRENHSRPSKR
jgi:hypothetical protein